MTEIVIPIPESEWISANMRPHWAAGRAGRQPCASAAGTGSASSSPNRR